MARSAQRVPLLKIVNHVWHTMDDSHFGLIAAGVAFYTIFAIFPGMAATIAIWSLFADPVVMRDYLMQIQGVIPNEAYEIIERQLIALLSASTGTLGWATAISLSIALYSVHSGVVALVRGLNAVHASRRRKGIVRHMESIALTLTLIAVFLLALSVVVLVPIALNFVPIGSFGDYVLRFLPWIVMFVVLLFVLGLFYRWGPNIAAERHPWVTPGALLAAFLWAIASMAFSYYLTNFGAYNRIYGSIGAVIALLMWLYISAYIVLLGAAVNAARQQLARTQ